MFFLATHFLIQAAYSIGDSGGCSDFPDKLDNTLAFGSANELEFKILKNQNDNTKYSPIKLINKNKLTVYSCGSPVDSYYLLKIAAEHGNIEAVKYLVENGAVIKNELFQKCEYPYKIKPSLEMDLKRSVAFKYLIGTTKDKPIKHPFSCRDPNLIELYIKEGMFPNSGDFRALLDDATRPHNSDDQKLFDAITVYIKNGRILESQSSLENLLEICATPSKKRKPICEKISRLSNVNLKPLLFSSQSSLDNAIQTCIGHYLKFDVISEDDADCSILDGNRGIDIKKFNRGLDYARTGNYSDYLRIFIEINKDMPQESHWRAYRSDAIFHHARASALTCSSNSENLLKAALAYEQASPSIGGNEAAKRHFELGYYYFDHENYFLASQYLNTATQIGYGLWIHAITKSRLYNDLSIAYSNIGNKEGAEFAKRSAESIYKNNKDRIGGAFEREKYKAICN